MHNYSSYLILFLIFNTAPQTEQKSPRQSNIATAELRALSEELLNLDTNNVGNLVQLNLQGVTNSAANTDKARAPLFGSLPASATKSETFRLFEKLLDNYDEDVTVKEDNTAEEKNEEQKFLNAVMATKVMGRTEKFLKQKGKITGSLRPVLQKLWFTPYSRSRRVLGSSGFEHVFLGEIKNAQVSGLHNWLFFQKEENKGVLDYKGYMKHIDLGNKGAIVKLRFDWLKTRKSVGSMFVGTSPELEMALYTVCFFARENKGCSMQMNKKRFTIKVYSQNWNGNKMIGSAFPEIY